MSMPSYSATLKILTKLATANKTRKGFLDAVKARFPVLGKGAFRLGFSSEGNDYAFKVRRHAPRKGSGFSQREIDSSNQDEYASYIKLKKDYPEMAAFVLAPIFYKLPNKHDVVFMPRVETLGENFDYDTESWDDLASDQFRMITHTFSDAHGGNIGYVGNPEEPGCRFYLIDLNCEGSEHVYCSGTRKQAKKLRARMLKNKVAA